MFEQINSKHKFASKIFPLLSDVLFITALILAGIGENQADDCQLLNPDDAAKEALERLKPLHGKTRDITEYDSKENKHSLFKVSICDNIDSKSAGAGVLEYDFADPTKIKSVIGKIGSTTASMHGNSISLSYHDGEKYSGEVCNNTHRMATIMFVCEETIELGEMVLLEKYDEKNPHCFYLFEVGSLYACQKRSGLSGGSIFCILFFTGVSIYLLLGFLYQRLVVGAKGLEQIPNYTFWRDFGNLQADGCDFLCRCGPRQEAQSYRGIDDRGPRDDERDDQLLNM